MAIKNLTARLGLDTSGFQHGLKQTKAGVAGLSKETSKATVGLSGMTSGLKSMAKAGLAMVGVTAGLKGLSDSAKAFTGLESSVQRTSDLFGGAAKYVTYFAENTAKSMGMAEATAYQYASTYGNLFKGITANSSENAKVTIAMMKASAVVASKTGRTMEDVNERIRSGILGSTEAIEDLGINVPVAMLQTTKAFQRIADGRPWESLTYQEQQQVRVLAILEQAHNNYGDTVQKNSAYNMAAFSGALKDMTAYAGQFVNAGLQPIIKGLTQMAQAATVGMKALAGIMGLKIETGDTSGTDAQTAAQDALTNAVEATAKARQKLMGVDEINTLSSDSGSGGSSGVAGASTGGVFGELAAPEFEIKEPDTSWISSVQSKFSGLADFFKTKFSPSVSAWGKAFSSLKAPASEAFDKIKGSVGNLWDNSIKPFGSYLISDWMPSIANGFSATFAPIFEQTMPALLSTWTSGFDFACQQISLLVTDVYQPTMERIKTAAADAFAGIQASWDEHGTGILSGFQGFGESLQTIWTGLYDNVFKPVFTYIGDTVSWLWDKHLKPLWDNVSDFVGSLSEFLFAFWNNVLSPIVQYIVKEVGPPIAYAVGIIGDVFGTVFGVISDVVGGLLKSLGGLLDFLTGVFTGNWKKAWEGLKQFFDGLVDAMWGTVRGTFNLIIDGLNTLWGGIYMVARKIVDIVGGIAGAIGAIFGKDWSFSMPATVPKIPKLATGGIVDSPTLAMVGEAGAEAVMPLENNTGWIDKLAEKIASVGGTGGSPEYLHADIYLDGGIVDTLVTRINRSAGRGGASVVPAT